MNTLQIIKSQSSMIRSLAAQYKAANPRIFGSVALAEDNDFSDIDVLVDPMPGATLFDLGTLQQKLEMALGKRVDLLTPNDLPEKFRHQVLQTAVAI